MADKPLNHFYHIFADSAFENAVNEHATALLQYGLAENLDNFFVGLVGSPENQHNAIELLQAHGLNPIIAASAEQGWEQVTMEAIRQFVKTAEGAVLYAHTKGSFNATPINIMWRASMCYYNVVQWQNMINALNIYDVAGCHWLHVTDEENDSYFFGGTYWWANVEYLKTLPELKWDTRWSAEPWIGTNRPKAFDANPGWPHPSIFKIDWAYNV